MQHMSQRSFDIHRYKNNAVHRYTRAYYRQDIDKSYRILPTVILFALLQQARFRPVESPGFGARGAQVELSLIHI